MPQDDLSGLKKLGATRTEYTYDSPTKDTLETFENRFPERGYTVELICPEFTSLCPKTGQPDFGTIRIKYRPAKRCVETKSLKLYLLSFRNQGSFVETIVNTILNDLVAVCDPEWMRVTGSFTPRGGITIECSAEHTPG